MKYKRILGYGGLGLTLIALGVAFVKPISTSNLLIRARADMGNLSVTFNSTGTQTHTDAYTYYRSGTTSLGNTFYLRNRTDVVPSSAQVAVMCGTYDKKDTEPEITFTTTNTGTTLFEFKNIKSISAVTNSSASRTLTVLKSSNGLTWNDAGSLTISSSGGTNTDVAGAKYIKLTYSGSGFSAYLTSFTINYSCSDEPEPEKELSSISVSTAPTKTSYTEGEYFDPTGLVITRTYSDSTSDTYSYAGHTSEFSFSPSTSTALSTSDASVTITYDGKSCNQAITVSAAPSGLSGTYTGTYTSIEFTSSTAGTYIYGSERLYFTYVVSGATITFTYVSGDNTSFGSYRLFAGGSSPKVNSTGSIVSSSQISVKTYNMFDSATSRTFTKS